MADASPVKYDPIFTELDDYKKVMSMNDDGLKSVVNYLKSSKKEAELLKQMNKLAYLLLKIRVTGLKVYPLYKGTKVPIFQGTDHNASNDVNVVASWFTHHYHNENIDGEKVAKPVGSQVSLTSPNQPIHDVAYLLTDVGFAIDQDVDQHNELNNGKEIPEAETTFNISNAFLSQYDINGSDLNNKYSIMETSKNYGTHYLFSRKGINKKVFGVLGGSSFDTDSNVEIKLHDVIGYPSSNYRLDLGDAIFGLPEPTKNIKNMLNDIAKNVARKEDIRAKTYVSDAQLNDLPLEKGPKWHNFYKRAYELLQVDDSQQGKEHKVLGKGHRNNVLSYQFLPRLRSLYKGISFDDFLKLVQQANEEYIEPSLDNRTIKTMAKHYFKKEPKFYVTDAKPKLMPVKNAPESTQKAQKMVIDWLASHDKNNKYMPYQAMANIMLDCFHFVRFDNAEGSRFAIYIDNPKWQNYGLYSQNYDDVRRIINDIYSNYSSSQIDEVITKINLSVRKVVNALRWSEQHANLRVVNNGVVDTNVKDVNKMLLPFSPKYIFLSKVYNNFNAKWATQPEPCIDGFKLSNWIIDLARSPKDKISKTTGKPEPDTKKVVELWQVLSDVVNSNGSHGRMPFFYSEKDNSGKGTFQELINNLVGDGNRANLKMAEFAKGFNLSSLVGKMVVIGDDNDDIYIKDISNLNSIITHDSVRVEYKGQTPYSTYLNLTVVQSGNHLPRTSNPNGFNHKRMLLIPFEQHFVRSKNSTNGDVHENTKIKSVYLRNKDVLEFCLFKTLTEFANFDVYTECDAGIELQNQNVKDNDSIRAFIEDDFYKWAIRVVSRDVLYHAYSNYCDENGVKPVINKNKFRRKVEVLLSSNPNNLNYEYTTVYPNAEDKKYARDLHDKNIISNFTLSMYLTSKSAKGFKLDQ